MNRIILTTIFLVYSALLFSQEDSTLAYKQIDISNFNDTLFEKLLLNKINKKRLQNLDDALAVNKILQSASDNQAQFMAKYGSPEIRQSGKTKTTERRIVFHGGSAFGKEFVVKYKIKKGEKAQLYNQATDEIAFKWLKNKKISFELTNPKYIFTGVSVASGETDPNTLFISFVLGNYKSLNSGTDRLDELNVPYSKRKYGLKPYDVKACKKADAYKNLVLLQKGLSLEDGAIYFETNDFKRFKKIMKRSKDGIAVDIVQKEQYSCGGLNIINNNKPWKGVMKKRFWAKKLLRKNIYKKDKKARKTKLKVRLVKKLPKGIGENIDLNLIIIQDKHVCLDIMPSYVEDAALENTKKIDCLADTVTTENEIDYLPTAEESDLVFRVPFQRSKFDYQESDIQPIIESLKEPEFVIDNIEIDAFSSIEGSVKTNERLQAKRAESIEKALKTSIATHKNIKKAKVETATNWEAFKRDVVGTEFEQISKMSLAEAQAYIKSEKLAKKLEPILEKHRYAEVKLHITYDIEGDKEQAYVVSRFNKAVKNSDRIKALSIQKYIFKKVLSKEYDAKAVNDQVIPDNSADFAGILMNKYWLQKYLGLISMEDSLCEKMHVLYKLDSSNPYLLFNDVYCDIEKTNLADEKRVNDIRQRMDDLYETNIPEQTVDALNLEYLFGVIEAVDTVPETPQLALESLDKIKEIVDIDEMNWKNALKLSYLFIEHNDYNYSAKLLEPFLNDDYVFEEILFTYISLGTHSAARLNSNRYAKVVEKALKANPDRLKELFTSERISRQAFDNIKVKELLCKELNL